MKNMSCIFYGFILKYKIVYTFTGLQIIKMPAPVQACWLEDGPNIKHCFLLKKKKK
jgi:hypothetical protein